MAGWQFWRGAKHYTKNRNKGVKFDKTFMQVLRAELPIVVSIGASEGGEDWVDEFVDLARCGHHVEQNREALVRLAYEAQQSGLDAGALLLVLENPGQENPNAKRSVRARAAQDGGGIREE